MKDLTKTLTHGPSITGQGLDLNIAAKINTIQRAKNEIEGQGGGGQRDNACMTEKGRNTVIFSKYA